MNIEEYIWAIKHNRIAKDKFFKESPQSPIPLEEREDFKGLNYYEPKPEYMFNLELEEFANKEHIQLEDSVGNIRDYLRWGRFVFEVDGVKCVLHAYKTDADEERLFVPFKDATNGKETYAPGRYIDLIESEDKDEGKWFLDFNLATNPWCAYSHDYACPLIPFENILKVKIEAGEKSYK